MRWLRRLLWRALGRRPLRSRWWRCGACGEVVELNNRGWRFGGLTSHFFRSPECEEVTRRKAYLAAADAVMRRVGIEPTPYAGVLEHGRRR